MHIPTIQGIIARRLLVNYRLEPEIVVPLLPSPFRPHLIHGVAMAGICLIRLEAIRPQGLPALLGMASENAAHRIAVEWDDQGQLRSGVFIPRRDTNSRVNTVVGGRLFPGIHHHAHVTTVTQGTHLRLTFTSDDRQMYVTVAGHADTSLPMTSVFHSITEASTFFERGSLGYSATHDPRRFDGLELRSQDWHVEPFTVEHVESSFFDDRTRFPVGTVTFDCALLMRNIAHEWHERKHLWNRFELAG